MKTRNAMGFERKVLSQVNHKKDI